MKVMIIGRFQPFHKGHLEAAKYLTRMGDLLLVIGSAQYSSTLRNPFNYEERAEMVTSALEEAKIHNFDIYPVKDIHDHKRWAQHVKAEVPHFDAVFTNSKIDRAIFESAGETVLNTWLYERENLTGTRIREAIALGNDVWKDLVPPAVARFLDEIGAQNRLARMKQMGLLSEDRNIHSHNEG